MKQGRSFSCSLEHTGGRNYPASIVAAAGSAPILSIFWSGEPGAAPTPIASAGILWRMGVGVLKQHGF